MPHGFQSVADYQEPTESAAYLGMMKLLAFRCLGMILSLHSAETRAHNTPWPSATARSREALIGKIRKEVANQDGLCGTNSHSQLNEEPCQSLLEGLPKP